jgi:hypothetical protein
MSVTERRRHALHEWAKQTGDEEVAATLMELLPPVGWADVATKRDLDHFGTQLRNELRAEMSGLRTEVHQELADVHVSMSSLEARVHRELRVQLFGIMGSIWVALGVALAVLGR